MVESHDCHMMCSPFPQGIQTPHPPQSEAVVVGPQVLLLLVCEVRLVPIVQGLVPLLLHSQVSLVALEGVLQHSTCCIRLLELVVDTEMGTGRLGMGIPDEAMGRGEKALAHIVSQHNTTQAHTHSTSPHLMSDSMILVLGPLWNSSSL